MKNRPKNSPIFNITELCIFFVCGEWIVECGVCFTSWRFFPYGDSLSHYCFGAAILLQSFNVYLCPQLLHGHNRKIRHGSSYIIRNDERMDPFHIIPLRIQQNRYSVSQSVSQPGKICDTHLLNVICIRNFFPLDVTLFHSAKVHNLWKYSFLHPIWNQH